MIVTSKPLLGPMQAIGPPRESESSSLCWQLNGGCAKSSDDQEVSISDPLLLAECPCKWCKFLKLSSNYKRKLISLDHYPETARLGRVTRGCT